MMIWFHVLKKKKVKLNKNKYLLIKEIFNQLFVGDGEYYKSKLSDFNNIVYENIIIHSKYCYDTIEAFSTEMKENSLPLLKFKSDDNWTLEQYNIERGKYVFKFLRSLLKKIDMKMKKIKIKSHKKDPEKNQNSIYKIVLNVL
jgi:hypothetical protein